jgi:hypothetical protein
MEQNLSFCIRKRKIASFYKKDINGESRIPYVDYLRLLKDGIPLYEEKHTHISQL